MNITAAEADAYSLIYGDAFHVFDEGRFVENYNGLLSAFQRYYANTQIAYSYKTNYMPAICRLADTLGGHAEVVSAMEYALTRRLGVQPGRVIYNGPCKSESSVREALTAGCILNLDSERDLLLLNKCASEAPSIQMRVGLRCNFPIDGYPDSRFGFDIDGDSFQGALTSIRALKNVTLAGLHCHFPHRDLRSFAARSTGLLAIAQRVFDVPPDFLSIGGGFFGNLPDSMKSRFATDIPSFDQYGEVVGHHFAAAFGHDKSGPVLFIEPGTALVADTICFVARVIDIKCIRSRNIACLAGSMFDSSPYARSRALPVAILRRANGTPRLTHDDCCDIVGYTCIEGDVLAQQVNGPLDVGDFVVFSNVGSYSLVMKPPFILPGAPIVARTLAGQSLQVKRAESNEYLFENFVF